MSAKIANLERLLETFHELTNKPEKFLNPDGNLSQKIKSSLKENYDLSKNQEIKTTKSPALPELIVTNFDSEQIWQQIELQNNSLLTRSLINVSKLIVNKDQLIFKNLEHVLKNANEAEDVKESDSDESDDDHEENNMVEDNDDNLSINSADFSDSEKEIQKPSTSKEYFKPSVVDDEFFKLNEMEQFLKAEEKKLNDPDSGNDSENSDESDLEGSINLFEDNSEDDEDKVKTARYKDFFIQADAEKEKPTKRNKFLEEMHTDEDSDEGTRHSHKETQSNLELRQERLKRKIEEIEESAVGEKPWQLKGEITAEGRPQNSLLQEVVEFDLTSRPAPVMTEQTTLQLEDIIRQRIKDKVFDSVQRKEKLVETPMEYKKKLVLDQEKSKESLAQIYEKDFLEQQAGLDPEQANKEKVEPELHKEVKTMMKSLFSKLDALSNFHFAPKPAMPELKIVSNLPAIAIEEVAPVAASNATLLAPEEIRNKTKGEIVGKSERTTTDKNRERRKKKQKQREHAKEKEKRQKVVEKMRPGLGNKYSKAKAKKMLEKVAKEKNVDKMDDRGKVTKSSKAFFSLMDEQVNKTRK